MSTPAGAPVIPAVIGVAGGALALGGLLTMIAGSVLAVRRYHRGECAGSSLHVPLGLLVAAAGCLLLLARGRW